MMMLCCNQPIDNRLAQADLPRLLICGVRTLTPAQHGSARDNEREASHEEANFWAFNVILLRVTWIPQLAVGLQYIPFFIVE